MNEVRLYKIEYGRVSTGNKFLKPGILYILSWSKQDAKQIAENYIRDVVGLKHNKKVYLSDPINLASNSKGNLIAGNV